MRKLATILLFCGLMSAKLSAQDRFFAFAAQSNVIPKNTRQIEVWYANKSGGYTYFNGNYARIGLKMGLGKNLLSEFFINVSNEAFVETEISHTDRKTRLYSGHLTEKNDVSFTNEIKWKLLDPVANPIGLAIYNDLTIGTRFLKINPKLILDKRIGSHFFTFNLSAEFDSKWEISDAVLATNQAPTVVKEGEVPLEFNLAYMRFNKKNNFGLGIEARSHNEITSFAGWEHSALFMGPAVHFRGENWFFNLSAMPQVTNMVKSWIAPDNLVLDEHQRFELRTLLGFAF